MAPFDRGTKRQCQHCSTKFYDLAKSPIVCPHCGKEFLLTEARPSRPAVVEKPVVEEVDKDPAATEAGAEVVSLEDADAEQEDDGEEIPDVEDVEVDDELADGDDDAFLEEDEEDDKIDFNVPGEREDT